MSTLESIIKEVENQAKHYNDLVQNCDTGMVIYYTGKLDGLTHALGILKTYDIKLERNEEIMVSKMESAYNRTKAEKWLGDL